ncbi:VLF-1 [Homarus gammarus nudivirus]|uniref:VLF-1 n=1 Tax=Homarus gammarus nudivirus TaxID=2509616 RepID=A0A411HB95_9VIRU|nr:VLF-1 [Homarus gammarus nudivirus]QBB28685.1 VLF-1 [Homarus gammarus nudivirus]
MIDYAEKSHISLLRNSNINLDAITNENVGAILNSLKTKTLSDISDNYKISILRTIKKHNNNIVKKPHQLKLKAKRSQPNVTIDYTKNILNVIETSYSLTPNLITATLTRSVIDTHIAILLITSCNMSVTDLFQLRVDDLKTLTNKQTVNKTNKIVVNRLFLKAEPIVRSLITHRNTLNDINTTHAVISCSPNIINKTLKLICIENAALLYKSVSINADMFKSIGISKFKFKQPDVLYTLLV